MNILFHTHTAITDSPHYHYSFTYSPPGIKYLYEIKAEDVILNLKDQKLAKSLSGLIRLFANLVGQGIPNISKVPNTPEKYDLIHAFNTIPDVTTPFILELESFHSLFIGPFNEGPTTDKIKSMLLQDNCKKILFWTKNAHDNFQLLMLSDPIIAKKSEILYPAVPLYSQNKSHKIPTIGFVARNFKNKGGEFILPIIENFLKAGRAKVIIITDIESIPKETFEKYKDIIDFKQLVPREELHKKWFPKIDILFYPGFSDTFGYIFPEVMSHGIPIITVDGIARKEIVNNDKNGYVIPGEISKYGFLNKIPSQEETELSSLALITNLFNKKTWRKMSNYCYEQVKSGQFSLYNRNKRLEDIYRKALKG